MPKYVLLKTFETVLSELSDLSLKVWSMLKLIFEKCFFLIMNFSLNGNYAKSRFKKCPKN